MERLSLLLSRIITNMAYVYRLLSGEFSQTMLDS